MKKLLLLAAAVAVTVAGYSQKSAFVNTEAIFKAIPEYNKAMEKIDSIAKVEQARIDAQYDKIAEMYDRYQQQKAQITAANRKSIEDNIIELEKKASQTQKDVFGTDGTIMKKRMELLKPIQDKVFAEVDKISGQKGYDLVLDISNNPSIVSYNKSLDISNAVLKALGINK